MRLSVIILTLGLLTGCSDAGFLGSSKSGAGAANSKFNGQGEGKGGMGPNGPGSDNAFPNNNNYNSGQNGGQYGDNYNTGDNSDADDPDGLPSRAIILTGSDNSTVASSATPGVMIVRFLFQNMRKGDQDLNFSLIVHSVDFSNISSQNLQQVSSSTSDQLVDYKIEVKMNYKAVPDVTRYKYQKHQLSYKKSDGTAGQVSGQFHMIVRPEGQGSDAAVKTELQGTAGHSS